VGRRDDRRKQDRPAKKPTGPAARTTCPNCHQSITSGAVPWSIHLTKCPAKKTAGKPFKWF
jgi:hypothetical protein